MRESVERGLGWAAGHRASAVAGVLTQWPEAHRRLSSVACTVVERTYHHQSARYTGHRAGSLLAWPYTTTQDRLRHRWKHISKLFFPSRGTTCAQNPCGSAPSSRTGSTHFAVPTPIANDHGHFTVTINSTHTWLHWYLRLPPNVNIGSVTCA